MLGKQKWVPEYPGASGVFCKRHPEIPRPLDHQTARQLVADLSRWRTHLPEVRDLLQAIDFQQAYSISFWDAMVLQSAARLGCKQLLSEDLSHGQIYGEVQVINPFND